MLIKIQVLDSNLEPVFESSTVINALHLVVIAESREAIARSKGFTWTAGAVSFFGKQLIDLMRAGNFGEEMERTALDVAMAAWLHDSIYGGVDEDTFIQSALEFDLMHDGTVRYQRQVSF